jgi:predicted kinase
MPYALNKKTSSKKRENKYWPRKRLFDITPTERASNEVDHGIYSAQASLQTYSKLAELASGVITAGYSVIIDAAFLKYEQRKPFQLLAESLAVPYSIIEITAAADILRQRIKERKHDVSDADLIVLEHQLTNWQPLHKDEMDAAIFVDTGEVLEIEALVDKIKSC